MDNAEFELCSYVLPNLASDPPHNPYYASSKYFLQVWSFILFINVSTVFLFISFLSCVHVVLLDMHLVSPQGQKKSYLCYLLSLLSMLFVHKH